MSTIILVSHQMCVRPREVTHLNPEDGPREPFGFISGPTAPLVPTITPGKQPDTTSHALSNESHTYDERTASLRSTVRPTTPSSDIKV